jgi:uncharacterized protein
MRPTAAELAATLGLEPHPEGGFFVETYRSDEIVATGRGARAASSAILFLVTAAAISRLHRLSSDELWAYQGGLPLELVTLAPNGELDRYLLGDAAATDPHAPSAVPQALVPAGSWQGARLAGGPHLPASRAWALMSCIVSPGFEFDDFELGAREQLLDAFPAHAGLVRDFT